MTFDPINQSEITAARLDTLISLRAKGKINDNLESFFKKVICWELEMSRLHSKGPTSSDEEANVLYRAAEKWYVAAKKVAPEHREYQRLMAFMCDKMNEVSQYDRD
ncbi:hypothetical protein KA107_03640 [Candidatus Pacearchaeota archaeon]|nr:hypothetical protein [Candidatus Pacearchaeota archaeon]